MSKRIISSTPSVQHPTRSSRVDYPIDGNWRLALYEEPGDIVIRVEHISPSEKSGKWHNVARLEQSKHEHFHAHLPGSSEQVTLSVIATREEKIRLGLDYLKACAERKQITCLNDAFSYSERWEQIKDEMVAREIIAGTTHNTKSIGGTASIIL